MFPATPSVPPPLSERVAISEEQVKKAKEVVISFGGGLEGAAVLLTQMRDVVAYSGVLSDENVTKLAETADAIWWANQESPAREVIRFEDVIYLEKEERHNLGLYSIHVMGALVLVIGWPVEVSLTQLRAEAYDAVARLRLLLTEE